MGFVVTVEIDASSDAVKTNTLRCDVPISVRELLRRFELPCQGVLAMINDRVVSEQHIISDDATVLVLRAFHGG